MLLFTSRAAASRRLGVLTACALVVCTPAVVSLTGSVAHALPRQAANVVTPGNFTGFGFDQCEAPSQSSMDAWLTSSPYWAVGIYISGASRGCTSQPNLTPAWISTQLANGWRLLPITLGPQASCTTRTRYLHQVRINPDRTHHYAKARKQGRAEAAKTVGVAQQLGIAAGSTLWYDIEAFDIGRTDCRESALSFLSAWTNKLHALGFVSGIYSSAASGIKMLDDALTYRPGTYLMPDVVWIADWNGRANVYSSYVRDTSWMPHKRAHQYRGGHDERYGGVTINIDNNFVDLGTGSAAKPPPSHCGGVRIDFGAYQRVTVGDQGKFVKAAQCLFHEKAGYKGPVDGVYSTSFGAAVAKYRAANGMLAKHAMSRRTWTVLTSQGSAPLLKYGAGRTAVRRLQRALNAIEAAGLAITGVFEGSTTSAVKHFQSHHHLASTGVVTAPMWKLLQSGPN